MIAITLQRLSTRTGSSADGNQTPGTFSPLLPMAYCRPSGRKPCEPGPHRRVAQEAPRPRKALGRQGNRKLCAEDQRNLHLAVAERRVVPAGHRLADVLEVFPFGSGSKVGRRRARPEELSVFMTDWWMVGGGERWAAP